MNITRLKLLSADLQAQRDFYANILELPVQIFPTGLEVKAGATDILFTQAPPAFDGAYHFAFNIPENQIHAAKEWISSRVPLLHDESGIDEFDSKSWNSDSVYFKDAAGNVLEFIARHNLKNPVDGGFDSQQILNVSEIGLPAEDVIGLAHQLCTRLGLSVFMQEPNESFTPVGDDNGLFILPATDRIWKPDSGVPAKLLPVKVKGVVERKVAGQATRSVSTYEVSGVPYEIIG